MIVQVNKKPIIGWREWVKLPDLNLGYIKAKVDTGARTSSLHAFDLETFHKRGIEYVRFKVHPKQRNSKKTVIAEARVCDYRKVKSSNGYQTERPVILTTLELLGKKWIIELTLSSRDEMGFRMLLGRESFRKHMLVDANRSYYSQKPVFKKKAKAKELIP